MKGLKLEFPVAAFLTATLYLNAYFFQVGVLAFYGYPSITDSFNVSYVIEGVVPGLLFYTLSLFVYLILSFIKSRTRVYVFFVPLPLIIFLYWMYEVNAISGELGVKRYSEEISVAILIISFYGTMLAYSNFRQADYMDAKFKCTYAFVTLLSVVCSGTALGRMSSYNLGDVYMVDGVKSTYVLKVLNDKIIIADCNGPIIKYMIETDLSKIKMVKLSRGEDKKDFRNCLFNSVR